MWSPQQERALDQVGRWLRERPSQVFKLAGYAGTGKTTLARHLAESVQGRVYFAAFTGKAAHVLTKSGAPNASTIHSLIYNPKNKSQERLLQLESERAQLLTHKPVPENLLGKVDAAITAERNNLARPAFSLNMESPLKTAGLLVVDEYSMIDQQMGEDLLSFGCPILALGDPGQLPPIRGSGFFNGRPDITLTEIHRQARDNPIIWMSQQVREGKDLVPGVYGNSTVESYLRAKPTLAERVLSADQLLVGRNATRQSSNARVRQLREFASPYPVADDKLVCLRNNADAGLLNGQLWRVLEDSREVDGYVYLPALEGEDGARVEEITAHAGYFKGLPPDHWDRRNAQEFDFGYALTVHKSQGSQWDNVLLFDEWGGRDRQQWLYTAITRAAERINIIQM